MLFSLLGILIPLLSTCLALGLSVFVLTRNRRAWANRWLSAGLAIIGAHEAAMLASSLIALEAQRLVLFRIALGIAGLIAPTWLTFSLTFGESNGYCRFARWRPILLGLTAVVPLGWIGLAMGRVVQPLRLGSTGMIVAGLDSWGKIYFCLYLIGLALVLLHLENLYRSAERVTKWKIKFLVVGVFAAFAYQIVAGSFALLYGFIHPLYPVFGALAFLVGGGMIAFSLVRHRLLDVDIFVSRYVVYRSLTLVLVGGYLFFLGIVAEIFHLVNIRLDLLTGTFLAILGAVALTLVLLSEDVRRRTQDFLHTHFYKHKYDYRVEWMEYTRRLSRATSVPDIAVQTVTRILEVMWVRQAAMYVAGDSPGKMTLVHQVEYDPLPSTLELPPETVQALQEQARQIPSIKGSVGTSHGTVELARQLFGDIPLGCLVPVAALDSLVGLLIVGPEVSGKPFGVDDRDLLAAVAAQAGALLLNARLTQLASEGRELQLLARLSAFVAHDLKNAVSTLSMLAENAKLHMTKPEFQADAIRTLGDVTARMQRLLAALRSPEAQPGTTLRLTPLVPMVEDWLHDIGTHVPSRIRIETRLNVTPDVSVDPEQFRSVLQNLVLNAVEATPDTGTITVETLAQDGAVIVRVSDTGRGMSQEFIQRKLFRPFQTTKSRGLGIGLYQCREILRSFGGTISAESEEGKGVTMVVRLPIEAGNGHREAARCKLPAAS